jgi:putative SOS response-associated peptidase YedK
MPFYVTRKDGDLLTFASLWEGWGPDKLLTCTIFTPDASDGIKEPPARMPVMLPKRGFEPMLSGSEPVADPGTAAAVQIIPVSPRMNSPSYNEPACVGPLAV